MLFRPIRTLMLIGFCFLAGYAYARYQVNEVCIDAGGVMKSGLCIGAKQ